MYTSIFVDRNKTFTVHLWDDKKGKIELPLNSFRYAYKKKVGGMYKSIYGEELAKITKYDHEDPTLYESDVPIETRVLIDCYEDSDDVSEGNRVVMLDIEVDSTDGFPNVSKANSPITSIALYDRISDKYYVFIYDKKGSVKDFEKGNLSVCSYQNEESLLTHFITKYEEIQPTILTGWNIDNFDIPYLVRRIEKILDENHSRKLSPVGAVYYNPHKNRFVIGGVSCMDYLALYKRYTFSIEPNYRLDSIGKKIVGMGKVSYTGTLDQLLENDINKFIEYNLNDVKIVKALDDKLQFIELARSICHTGHVPYEDFCYPSRYLEGAILMYLRRNNLVAPNKPIGGREKYEKMKEDEEEGFSGAYVKDPIPGKYDWIYDLDLTSLYPSIIMSLNISPESKVSVLTNWDPEEFLRGEIKEFRFRQSDGQTTINLDTMGLDEFVKFVKDNKLSVASNGTLYRTDKQGVIPAVLEKWFAERVEFRKLEKKYFEEGNKEKHQFYKKRQHVQKILLNSIFGCIGLPIWRFYDNDNALAITSTGVTIIKTTAKMVNQYYNNILETVDKDYVIYTDTDSTFVSATPIIKKTRTDIDINDEEKMSVAIREVASDVQKFINSSYDIMAKRMFNITTHRFDIKQEVIARSGIWLAKKRYAQWIINNNGAQCDELEVKGLDMVRSSYPPKFRDFMSSILKDILKGKTREELDEKILQFKKDIHSFDVIVISKNTSVKEISKYLKKDTAKGRPAHVKAAIAYNDFLNKHGLEKKFDRVRDNDKVRWCYLKDNPYGIDGIAFRGDDNDPKILMDFINQYIDRNKIYERELKSKLEDFYQALNWIFPSGNEASAERFFEF